MGRCLAGRSTSDRRGASARCLCGAHCRLKVAVLPSPSISVITDRRAAQRVAKNGPGALIGAGASTARDATAGTLTTVREQLRRCLTWPCPSRCPPRALHLDAGLQIYSRDRRSPWQRATNENTNGLLRQHFPGGTNLARVAADELVSVAAALMVPTAVSLVSACPRQRSCAGSGFALRTYLLPSRRALLLCAEGTHPIPRSLSPCGLPRCSRVHRRQLAFECQQPVASRRVRHACAMRRGESWMT